MNRLAKAYHLLVTLGPGWVWFRVRYAARRKFGGLVRRSRLGTWPASPTARHSKGVRWFHPIADVGPGAVTEADEILAGKFRLFSRHGIELGEAPGWAKNPLTSHEAPAERHWSALGDFAFGDIKGIWELNRFPWAFALGRAYARTRDERYAAGFWRLFEDWLRHNCPNCGPNWMCGQEATFRLMASIWTSDVLHDAAESTPERRQLCDALVEVTAKRIAANLDYALSQSNNHGVSECVGLITAALRLRENPSAPAWAKQGWRELERQVSDLVYSDGGFSQHSAVYHRVFLHDVLWLISIVQRSGGAVPDWLTAGTQRALAFLDALLTPESGRVPLYGPNDGANILPLADGDFLDFRPVVQAGFAVLHGKRRLPPGPWDEAADWLANTAWRMAEVGTNAVIDEHFTDAGVFVTRDADLRVFLRCPTRFRHRPAQADLLHLDLEWRGQPIVHDAGTYSYNAAGQFAGSLKEAAVHNTLTFDRAEPLQKVSRFLYLPWPKGRAGRNGNSGEFVATHDGWRRIGIEHERRLVRSGDGLRVIDRITGSGSHRARVHWLLADMDYELRATMSELILRTAKGPFRVSWVTPQAEVSLVRADLTSVRGWWSPYYGYAAPALSLAIEFDFEKTAEIVTTFAPIEPSTSSRVRAS